MLKTDADLKIVLDFVKEVDTVVKFEHKNVIRLLGICTEQLDQICMIFEYMELGALRELYFRKVIQEILISTKWVQMR